MLRFLEAPLKAQILYGETFADDSLVFSTRRAGSASYFAGKATPGVPRAANTIAGVSNSGSNLASPNAG